MARKTATKAAPVEETIEETTPASTTLGTKWLADVVNEAAGTNYSSYQLRILLRKLTKEGVIDREEGNYSFSGEDDPKVVAVVDAVKGGALEREKKERVASARATKAAKKAAAPAEDDDDADTKPAKPRARRKPKPEPVQDDDDMDLDEI